MATLTVDASKNIGDVNLFKDYNNLTCYSLESGSSEYPPFFVNINFNPCSLNTFSVEMLKLKHRS